MELCFGGVEGGIKGGDDGDLAVGGGVEGDD